MPDNAAAGCKKAWTTPKLTTHGTVESITQVTKTLGFSDGVIFDIDGQSGPTPGVPIGPES